VNILVFAKNNGNFVKIICFEELILTEQVTISLTFYANLRFSTVFYTSQPLDQILGHFNPFLYLTSYFFQVHLNVIYF